MKGGLSCSAGAELAKVILGMGTATVSASVKMSRISFYEVQESGRMALPDNK